MKNNISRQEYIVAVLFIVIVVFFYLMNVDIPFFSDDDSCMYLFGHRISTAKDLFNAIVFDYKGINGRILCNVTVLLSIMMGETVFNIINTLFFIAVIPLIIIHIGITHKERIWLFFSVATIGFLMLSTGVDSMYYWASAASNYMWAFVFNLLFFLILKKQGRSDIGNKKLLLLCCVSFILALNNEALICPIAGGLVLYYMFHVKHLNKGMFFLIASYGIGMLIVVFAPGNFSRMSFEASGLGIIGRMIKIFYFLRITYIMLLMLIILMIKNKTYFLIFLKQNVLLLLMFILAFFIPFVSAASMRGVYGIEIFSLLIILRLIDFYEMTPFVNFGVAFALSSILVVFQSCVLHDSHIKWGIYQGAMQKYYSQKSNTVMIDDYQSKNPLIGYYTMSLDNMFMPYDKANQYALKKLRRQGLQVNKEEADNILFIKVLASNVYEKALKKKRSFFLSKNKIPGMGFYHDSSLNYSVMPYDRGELDSINKGYMYAIYSISFDRNIRVRINYMLGDVDFERAAFDVQTKYGRYILLNRKFKSYPFLRVERIALSKTLPRGKIQIYRYENR